MHATNAATRAVSAVSRPWSLSTVLWIGLVAGTLDISDNLIYNALRGVTPAMVFRFIASGLIGIHAAEASWLSVPLGVVLHYFIALSWTAIFYAASHKFAMLLRRPVISGLLYGGFVYLFMNIVVVPLSRVPHLPFHISLAGRINAVLSVVIFIGPVVALLVRRSAVEREQPIAS
jgi:uncharacterized membrane protein YagU involved in acid resistance